MPWRIVIGRLGRLGHGELKSKTYDGDLLVLFSTALVLFVPFRLGHYPIEEESRSLRHVDTRFVSHVSYLAVSRSTCDSVRLSHIDGDAPVVDRVARIARAGRGTRHTSTEHHEHDHAERGPSVGRYFRHAYPHAAHIRFRTSKSTSELSECHERIIHAVVFPLARSNHSSTE